MVRLIRALRMGLTASSICFIDPHLFKFGSACPCIASGDADHVSYLVVDYKAQPLAVIVSCCMTIVVVKTVFNCVDFNRRKIMPWFYSGGHIVLPAGCRKAASLGCLSIYHTDERPVVHL